jgi:hypothetical protein
MLQKLKIKTYVFISCLFGLTLMTVTTSFAKGQCSKQQLENIIDKATDTLGECGHGDGHQDGNTVPLKATDTTAGDGKAKTYHRELGCIRSAFIKAHWVREPLISAIDRDLPIHVVEQYIYDRINNRLKELNHVVEGCFIQG